MHCAFLRWLILVALCTGGASGLARAATWYVSDEGDDAADGHAGATALRTIAAAADRAQTGDTILLRRGDVFREAVETDTPGLVFDTYGPADGERPAVSGSVPMPGWVRYQGPIWVAETGADIGYLYVNGRLMTIARYPNEGWLRTKVWREERLPTPEGEQPRRRRPRLGRTFVTCPELAEHPRNANDYWAGSTIRWRHHSWWYETRPVEGYQASGELTLGDRSFTDEGPYDWDEKGWGFYLDGKLEELDAPGEWYFDAEAGKVYLYPPDDADPNDLLVEGTVIGTGMKVRDAVVRNVAFRHQKDYGLEIDGRCTVESCLFEGIGRDAPVSGRGAGGGALHALAGTADTTLRNNEFRDNLNNSIEWWQGRDATGTCVIEQNTVVNSGTVPGYGGSGSWHGVGILIGRGVDVRVRHNRIDGTGYAGILLGSDGNTAEYNVITNAMSTMNDGAGIYTNCSRSTIRHNVILHTNGGMESSGTWQNISHGIWMEFLREYHDSVVEGNTCAWSGGEGLFLGNNYTCLIKDNVFFGNHRYQMQLTGRGDAESEDTTQEHQILGNVFCAEEPGEHLIYFDPRFDYGTLEGNWYYAPGTPEPIVEGKGWPGTNPETGHTLADWIAHFPWADKQAKIVTPPATAGGPNARAELFVNEDSAPKTIRLEAAYIDLDGNPVEGAIELPPCSSRVLIRAAAP